MRNMMTQATGRAHFIYILNWIRRKERSADQSLNMVVVEDWRQAVSCRSRYLRSIVNTR